ncbi:MAG: hypothetical protein KAU50_03320 [Candidatus Marinimicrobia bacterium]|nr:hypothetical protein [Candidatus Neomarinimicrobiota bacterium]
MLRKFSITITALLPALWSSLVFVGCTGPVESSLDPGILRVILQSDPADTSIVVVSDTLTVLPWNSFDVTVFQGKVYSDSNYALLFKDITAYRPEDLTYNVLKMGAIIDTATFVGNGLNDATSGGEYYGESNVYKLEIVTSGTPDTINVYVDDFLLITGTPITDTPLELIFGATITWEATTGHTVGDYWTFKARTTGEYLQYVIYESYVPPIEYDQLQLGITPISLSIGGIGVQVKIPEGRSPMLNLYQDIIVFENKVTEVNLMISPLKSVHRFRDTYHFVPQIEVNVINY